MAKDGVVALNKFQKNRVHGGSIGNVKMIKKNLWVEEQ